MMVWFLNNNLLFFEYYHDINNTNNDQKMRIMVLKILIDYVLIEMHLLSVNINLYYDKFNQF